jgi:hydrogenase maturation protease
MHQLFNALLESENRQGMRSRSLKSTFRLSSVDLDETVVKEQAVVANTPSHAAGAKTGSRHTLLVGVGSSFGDDQAGWRAAKGVADRVNRNSVQVRLARSPAELLNWIDGFERLVVCDACRGSGPAGEIRRYEWPTKDLADLRWSGTHDLPLPVVLALAQQLDRLPNQVVIWVVEGHPHGTVGTVSRELAEAIPRLINEMLRDLN